MTDDTFYGTSDKIVLLNSIVLYFTFELTETELFLTKLMLADLKGVFCREQSPGMADENLRPSSGKPIFKASKDPVILNRKIIINLSKPCCASTNLPNLYSSVL